MKAGQKVKVKEQFLAPGEMSMTALPQELVDHFDNLGRQVILVYSDPRASAMESAYHREPVLFSELPEDVQQACRRRFDPPEKHSDLLHLGDCIVRSQSYEARDYYRAYFKQKQAIFEDAQDRSAEQIAESLDSLGVGHIVSKVEQRGGKLADQAIGGPEIAAIIAAQQAGR